MALRVTTFVLLTLLLASAFLCPGTARAVRTHCPVGALVLPASGIEQAAKAAARVAATTYPGLNTQGATVISAKRATSAGPRSAEVGRQCGALARARTVIVEMRFPRMLPSASLSEGVVDVSRFEGGYRVWAVVR